MSDKKKVVWILGAGFSKPLGGPLLTKMFTLESLETICETYPDSERFERYFRRIVRAYILGAYDVDLSDHSKDEEYYRGWGLKRKALWRNSEEFLERLDIAFEAGDDVSSDYKLIEGVFNSMHGGDGSGEGGAFTRNDLLEYQRMSKTLYAAECDRFLVDNSTEQEKWSPYKEWVSSLSNRDVILTFNQDRLLDILSSMRSSNLGVVSTFNHQQYKRQARTRADGFKLHGSVSWRLGPEDDNDRENRRDIDITQHNGFLRTIHDPAIATPGVSKHNMINQTKLGDLWSLSREYIRGSDVIIFIGYRFPPSDADSRDDIINCIAVNNEYRKQNKIDPLYIHTVLGDDIHHPDSRRLKGLLLASGCESDCIVQHPLWAEDFLGCYDYKDIGLLLTNIYI